MWTYGIQLWGTAKNSNVEILQRYQSKTLRFVTQAPWFVTNAAIHKDLNICLVKDTVIEFSSKYVERLSNHNKPLDISLLDETEDIRRLKRLHV